MVIIQIQNYYGMRVLLYYVLHSYYTISSYYTPDDHYTAKRECNTVCNALHYRMSVTLGVTLSVIAVCVRPSLQTRCKNSVLF